MSGINETEAVDICTKFLLSVEVVSTCRNVPNIDIELTVRSCVADIGVSI